MNRISPDRLNKVSRVVFGESRFTGPAVARRVGTSKVTLWSWLNRTGLPVEQASKLSDELLRRASELMEAAADLRQQASQTSTPQ